MNEDFELHCNVFHSLKVSGFCKGKQGDAKRREEQHIKRMGVCKTRTGYLRMADADGKMRIEKCG